MALPALFLDHGYFSCLVCCLSAFFLSFLHSFDGFASSAHLNESFSKRCPYLFIAHLSHYLCIWRKRYIYHRWMKTKKKQSIKRCIRNSKAARRIASVCFFWCCCCCIESMNPMGLRRKHTWPASVLCVCVCRGRGKVNAKIQRYYSFIVVLS